MVTSEEHLSENVEEYLETIFRITHRSAAPRGGQEQDSTHRSAAPRGGQEQDSTHRSAAPRGGQEQDSTHRSAAPRGGQEQDSTHRSAAPRGGQEQDSTHRSAAPRGGQEHHGAAVVDAQRDATVLQPRTAKTGEIAAELGLSPPSVTEMTKRLKEKGYVEYEPYRGVRLTAKGSAHAQMLLRRHRIVQAFLEQVLGMPKEEAHEWGCRMEHAVPPELERYLYMKLPDKDLKGLAPPRSPEETGTEVREAPATPHPRRTLDPSPRRQGPAKRGSVPRA